MGPRARATSDAPRRPLRGQKGQAHPTAPSLRSTPAEAGERVLVWLEGQRPDGAWVSIYCSENELLVRAWHRRVIDLPDDDPMMVREGLDVFEDFRVKREGEGAA